MSRIGFGVSGERFAVLDCEEAWEAAELQSVQMDLEMAGGALAQLMPLLSLPTDGGVTDDDLPHPGP